MIDCKKCETLVQKELDGEIIKAEIQKLQEHISACQECRETRDGLFGIREILRSDTPVEPPEGFIARLGAKLDTVTRVGFVEGYIVPFILANRIRLALASFILVVAGFGLLFSLQQQQDGIGVLFDNTGTVAETTIGIRSPGGPTYIIPVYEDKSITEKNDAVLRETEDALKGHYHDSDIHLASE